MTGLKDHALIQMRLRSHWSEYGLELVFAELGEGDPWIYNPMVMRDYVRRYNVKRKRSLAVVS